MGLLTDTWTDAEAWREGSPALAAIVLLVALFAGALVADRVAVRVLRRSYWRRNTRLGEVEHVAELQRVKRHQTLLTLLESVVRYGLFGAAAIVAVAFLSPGLSSAIFGATLLIILVGFGLQRILADVVAGALLLFEGRFAVGDTITVHQQGITGAVEEFSLRTTSLRTLGGDRVTILNGSILSFTRWSYAQREFRVEVLVRSEFGAADPVAAVAHDAVGLCEREASATNARFVAPPRTTLTELVDDDLVRVEWSVVVAPEHEVVAHRFAALVEAAFGDRVVGPVTTLPLYEPAFAAYRAATIVRD